MVGGGTRRRAVPTAHEYRRLGAEIHVHKDGTTIAGYTRLRGAETYSHGDHRLGNSLATAGQVAEGTTIVHGDEVIANTSYPNFLSDLHRLQA